jgi:hypothetical protein
MPPGLRTQVLRLASSNTPDAVAHRAELAQRAEMAGAGGFPAPFDQGKPTWYRARRNQGAAAAAVTAAAAVRIIRARRRDGQPALGLDRDRRGPAAEGGHGLGHQLDVPADRHRRGHRRPRLGLQLGAAAQPGQHRGGRVGAVCALLLIRSQDFVRTGGAPQAAAASPGNAAGADSVGQARSA